MRRVNFRAYARKKKLGFFFALLREFFILFFLWCFLVFLCFWGGVFVLWGFFLFFSRAARKNFELIFRNGAEQNGGIAALGRFEINHGHI